MYLRTYRHDVSETPTGNLEVPSASRSPAPPVYAQPVPSPAEARAGLAQTGAGSMVHCGRAQGREQVGKSDIKLQLFGTLAFGLPERRVPDARARIVPSCEMP